MNELEEIYRILRIPKDWKIVSIRRHKIKRGKKEYTYYNVNLVRKWGENPKQKYIPKKYEEEILKLWKAYRQKKEDLKRECRKKITLDSS